MRWLAVLPILAVVGCTLAPTEQEADKNRPVEKEQPKPKDESATKPETPPQENPQEGQTKPPAKTDEAATPAQETSNLPEIKCLNDLEKYSGQVMTLEGIFDVWEKPRGKHGILTLDSGLKVTLAHLDHIKKGEDWFQYVNKRIQVTGRLHVYVRHHVDGLQGPYLDEVSPFVIIPR